MAENDKKDFSFIKEKIKEQPVNRKKTVKRFALLIISAVLFGAIACLTFTLLQPHLQEWIYPDQNPGITIPSDSEYISGTEESETDTESETGTEIDSEETDSQIPGESESLTETSTEVSTEDSASEPVTSTEIDLSEYQLLQNKLYNVGKTADYFLVTVTGVTSDTDWYNNAYESTGQSSGILIADTGSEILVLTEYKSIRDSQEFNVTFYNGKIVEAALKNYDLNIGLAVLSITKESIDAGTMATLKFAPLGNSLATTQGTVVIAVGSPLGTNYTISTGNITSAVNKVSTVDHSYSIFTTDIVGSSNSTGALLNVKGEIIGLVMQDFSIGNDANTLTAISISELKKLIEMLSNGTEIPYIGLKVKTVTDVIATEYGLPKGVYITEVILDSPALVSGLQNGDIITQIQGDAVTTVESYEAKLLNITPGENISVVVLRQGADEYYTVECIVTAGHQS
ncbi:MAG: S1C family serine protease [Lachnospiraceae bacterium]